MVKTKRIAVLGSTGSVGTQTLDVVSHYPEKFQVEALAAGKNIDLLLEQVHKFKPAVVSVRDKSDALELRQRVSESVSVVYGDEGLLEAAAGTEADFVVNAIMGSRGLKPTLEAIKAGKHIGLANKETLIAAGSIVTECAKEHNVSLLPIDSEHSAIFQCLQGNSLNEVSKLILTASGGSFRDRKREELHNVTVEEALAHPNWSMGTKITIDSATMVNKGLEVIEAHWLFNMPYDRIEVLIHPQSIVHSMVEFCDYSIIAQLGLPDMRIPIQYALSYPHRHPSPAPRLNLAKMHKLEFREVDELRFPCLRMAYEAGKMGGTAAAVFNAANEVAVERFLRGEIQFLQIEELIERVLNEHAVVSKPSLDDILHVDQWTRKISSHLKLSAE